VQLTANFDFNRVTQTSDKFDPEGRVVRSSQTREETSAGDTREGGPVSASNELPGAPRTTPDANAASRSDNRKTEEIVNYEISRTTKTEVIEGGRVNRISVAVVVDGNYVKNEKGEFVYEPRSKEDIDRITALVRSAIGFDQKRGDQVEVVNLRLAETPQASFNESKSWLDYLQFTKDDIMRGIELLVMGLLGIVVLFFVVRPLLRRALLPDSVLHPALAGPAGSAGGLIGGPAAVVTGGGAGSLSISGGGGGGVQNLGAGASVVVGGDQMAATISTATSQMIDIAQVQGQVHAQSVQKVGELADKNPHETVSIIRQWLHEGA
jgi:flagellar M-ring protein FliF